MNNYDKKFTSKVMHLIAKCYRQLIPILFEKCSKNSIKKGQTNWTEREEIKEILGNYERLQQEISLKIDAFNSKS